MARILGIGCGLLAFGGFCVLGLFFSTFLARMSPATEAADNFLEDVHDQNWTSARARMDAEYQGHHSDAELQQRVQAIHELADHDVAFLASAETHDDGHVTVDGSLYGADGVSPIAFELSQTGDYWYIDLVAVAGHPLE